MANTEPPLFGKRFTIISGIIVVLGLIYLIFRSDQQFPPSVYPPEPVASGLTNPRALAVGPDGLIYVAEAGNGNGKTGQVSRITGAGVNEHIAAGLPSRADIGRLRPAGPTAIMALNGGWLVANIAAGTELIRVRRQRPNLPPVDLASVLSQIGLTGRLAPIGLVGVGDDLVVLDEASATLVRFNLQDNDNSQPIVLGRLPAGVNPINLARGTEGDLLVVDFGQIPYVQGSGAIWSVSSTGQVERVVNGLTMPVDVATGIAGELYIVEFSAFYNRRTDRFAPGTGRVVVARGAATRPMVSQLDFPTAIVLGGDNNLYFATRGAFSQPGNGRIWRIPSRSGFTDARP